MIISEKQIILESLKMIFESVIDKKRMDFDKAMSIYQQIKLILEEEKHVDK